MSSWLSRLNLPPLRPTKGKPHERIDLDDDQQTSLFDFEEPDDT